MPKFQIASDIHIESNEQRVIDTLKPVAEYLILAGDIGQPVDSNYHTFFQYVTSNWKKVIYVPGNHEYYDTTGIMTINRTNLMIEDMAEKYDNLYYLNNGQVQIDDITIIGSVLWSSPEYKDKLTDFRMNIFDDEGCITLDRFKNLNRECIEYLEKTLNNIDDERKVIVITHFLPLMKTEIPNSKFENDPEIDSYLGNKLYHLINKANIWVSGHTHEKFDFNYKGTRWMCNAYGQLFEKIPYKDMTFTL